MKDANSLLILNSHMDKHVVQCHLERNHQTTKTSQEFLQKTVILPHSINSLQIWVFILNFHFRLQVENISKYTRHV